MGYKKLGTVLNITIILDYSCQKKTKQNNVLNTTSAWFSNRK